MKKTEKIKILRVITRLNVGGPATHVILLNEGLNDGEFGSRLITGRCDKGEGDMNYLAKEKGVEPFVIPQLKRKIEFKDDLIAFAKIFNLIRKEKPHVVHTHMSKAGTLGRLAAICLGVPVKVHTFHGHVFHSYFSPLGTKTALFIERIFARFTDRVIAVSDSVKSDVCDQFRVTNKERTSVIGLGLDLDRFRRSGLLRGLLRKDLKLDEKALLVGIVGRLTAVKNHKLFLKSAQLLKKESPGLNLEFLVVGDGELRRDLEKYVTDLGIGSCVHFIGWRKDMPTVYSDLDIVALTSLNEGTPLSLIEAMASGKAVVATSVGGVPNLIKDGKTGLLVDSNNTAQLKEAIMALLCDERLRTTLGQEGAKFVCEKYSKERLVGDVKNLYKTLLKEKEII